MSEKAPNQASSKEDLDQLSALEKSMASFGMGDLDSEHGVILKDWSAQDFAKIYVRFRPHLISHARKFLREETQAEEVVQDAFLYLMTALPELDSELGVLRFLKWKTKMNCLDLIRASSRNQVESLPDDLPTGSPQDDLSSDLERAEDAAVVASALASLSPRHREALISSIYLEKPYGETAGRMGLSENAFRQLLYRAKKTFRLALIGQANVEGKTVSEILSVAVRKASSGHGVRVSSVILIASGLLFGLTYLPVVAPVNLASQPGDYGSPADIFQRFSVPEPASEEQLLRPSSANAIRIFDGPDFPPLEQLDEGGGVTSESRQGDTDTDLELIKTQQRVFGNEDEIAKESADWTVALLTDLVDSVQTPETTLLDNRIEIEVGNAGVIFITLDPTRDYEMAFAVLRGQGVQGDLVAIPTGVSELSTLGSDFTRQSQIVMTGFAVSRLDANVEVPVIENSHLSDVAIEVNISLTQSGGYIFTTAKARFLPRA